MSSQDNNKQTWIDVRLIASMLKKKSPGHISLNELYREYN